MSSADLPAEASGDAQALAVPGDALDRLGVGSAQTAGELAALMQAAGAQMPPDP